MKCLLVDFETTGLNVQTDRIIEVGAQLVDESWEPIASVSCLVNGPNILPPSQEIQDITGITLKEWETTGVTLEVALDFLAIFIGEADVAMAYNADFDQPIFRAEMFRHKLGAHPVGKWLLNLPWVCAMRDLESNYKKNCWKLSHLALDYGLSVDPSRLHRAVDDVDLMRRVLKKSGFTAQQIVNFNLQPWIVVQAETPAPWTDGGKARDTIKKLGYGWERVKGSDVVYSKRWVKRIKESWLDLEIATVPYKVCQIKES